MPPTEELPAFIFRGATYAVGEVMRAAAFRGELGAPLHHLRWGEACARAAEEEGLEADGEDVEQAVAAFRYDHDLISAEETEAWLEARGLDADILGAHFAREAWLRQMKARIEAPASPPGSIGAEELGALAAALLISGGFQPRATALVRRLATPRPAGAADVMAVAQERKFFAERTAGDVGAWLSALGRGEVWLGEMLALEASYRAHCAAEITPEKLARALASARLPLTRLEVEQVEFDSRDAVREAELCVREDGLSLEQVAGESHYPFERRLQYAEDLPEAQRDSLLFARVGALIEVDLEGGAFQLRRVVNRIEPQVDEPEVRRRLETRILEQGYAEAIGSDLRWIIS